MKAFVSVILLAAVVVAEPPAFRQRFYKFQRQELQGSDEPKADEAPYAPAGFRPAVAFTLPSRQEVPPSTSYGVPDNSYAAPVMTYTVPQTQYGIPQTEYGVPEDKTERIDSKEGSGDVEQSTENITKENLQEEPKNDAEIVSNQGVYYVLLPGSQLQRVQFQTENDIRKMAYTARLQYSNEDRAPVYVYTAAPTVPQYQTAAYVQLF